jgi:hypothetical protein
MLALLKPFWLTILKYASIAGAILLVVFKIRQSGRDAERVENIEKVQEYEQVRDAVERDVNRGDNASERLRSKWSRKR